MTKLFVAILIAMGQLTDVLAQDVVDLMSLVPPDAAVVIEVNEFDSLLQDVQKSGLWQKVKGVPLVSGWLASDKVGPLIKLRRVLERETGKPINAFLSELAGDRFLIIARPAGETGDGKVESALLLKPVSEQVIETLHLLHTSSQKSDPLFGFLGDFVVVTSHAKLLDDITSRLEDHARGVKTDDDERLAWSRMRRSGASVRMNVGVSSWLSGNAAKNELIVKLFEESYSQVEVDLSFRDGLTCLIDFHSRGFAGMSILPADEKPLALTAQPGVMLTMRGRWQPGRMLALWEQLVEDKDRQEWQQFKQLCQLLWSDDEPEMTSLMSREWPWSLAMSLEPPVDERGPRALIDAEWTVQLPELSNSNHDRLDRLSATLVNLAATTAFTENQLTPEVRLISSQSADEPRGMWLDSIWGMTPGYLLTPSQFTISTLMSQTRQVSTPFILTTHSFEVTFRPLQVVEFLDRRATLRGRGGRLRPEELGTMQYRVLISLLEMFDEVQLTIDEEAAKVEMKLQAHVNSLDQTSKAE